jgi:hypothetical protein
MTVLLFFTPMPGVAAFHTAPAGNPSGRDTPVVNGSIIAVEAGSFKPAIPEFCEAAEF